MLFLYYFAATNIGYNGPNIAFVKKCFMGYQNYLFIVFALEVCLQRNANSSEILA